MWKGVTVLCMGGWLAAGQSPSTAPTAFPTRSPSKATASPTVSFAPTTQPLHPTNSPTMYPTFFPTKSPKNPSVSPTKAPTQPTASPTSFPTAPTKSPTARPSSPTKSPSTSPTGPTHSPSTSPPTVPPSQPATVGPTTNQGAGGFTGGSFSPILLAKPYVSAVFTNPSVNITRALVAAQLTAPLDYSSTPVLGLPTVNFRLQGPVEFGQSLDRPDLSRNRISLTFPVFMDFSQVAINLEAYTASLRLFLATRFNANYYQFRDITYIRNRDGLHLKPKNVQNPALVENTARRAETLVAEEGLITLDVCSPNICPDEWDDDFPGWAWAVSFIVPISSVIILVGAAYACGLCCFAKDEEQEPEELGEEVDQSALLENEIATSGVTFEEGKDQLTNTIGLSRIATLLREHPTISITVNGHSTPKDADIAHRRGEYVRDELIKLGVDAKRLSAHGWAATSPLAGHQPNDPAQNRVTFGLNTKAEV
eukprot:Hpha_TRINITY_DN16341_c1_g14::TRINITY_DN16341_c1_g14_i1::g.59772::m.59772